MNVPFKEDIPLFPFPLQVGNLERKGFFGQKGGGFFAACRENEKNTQQKDRHITEGTGQDSISFLILSRF
jgi:hypothetical protein